MTNKTLQTLKIAYLSTFNVFQLFLHLNIPYNGFLYTNYYITKGVLTYNKKNVTIGYYYPTFLWEGSETKELFCLATPKQKYTSVSFYTLEYVVVGVEGGCNIV